jgi:hypothetical protein
LLYPDEEIAAKEVKLNGILVTEAAGWYEKQLAAAGFTEVEVVMARFGFVTWVARKGAADVAHPFSPTK